MVILNITYSVDAEITNDWIDWMKTYFIPKMMETGLFEDHRFVKVLSSHEPSSTTYSCQYMISGMAVLGEYQDHYADKFDKILFDKFNQRCIPFATVLQEI